MKICIVSSASEAEELMLEMLDVRRMMASDVLCGVVGATRSGAERMQGAMTLVVVARVDVDEAVDNGDKGWAVQLG
jgi:hypothetical protein